MALCSRSVTTLDPPSPADASRGATATAPLPCVIDLEASGFGAGSYPIEIGYVREDGQAWCTLIQPEPDWTHWSAQAEAVHGIGRAQLLSQGRQAADVGWRLNGELAGRTVYTDAWGHDYAWLAKLYEAAGFAARFKLASVRELLSEEQLPRLTTLRSHAFDALGIARHRASSDARALQWALAQLLTEANAPLNGAAG